MPAEAPYIRLAQRTYDYLRGLSIGQPDGTRGEQR